MRIKRASGWEWEATGLRRDQVETAVKLRAQTQAIIDGAREPTTEDDDGPRLRVSSLAKRVLATRRAHGVLSVKADESRLNTHVLGFTFASGRVFGSMFVDEVRPAHARAIMRALNNSDLAPRTVINIDSIARTIFDEAVADEIIATNPWVIPKRERTKKRDKNPAWRATAKFTKAELRALLFAADDVVPWDRRVLYAMMYFGALRFGEASARFFADRHDTHPLRSLHVHSAFSTARGRTGETKTASVRQMPEHPVLTAILEVWRSHGFRQIFGREPTDGDLIVPGRMGGPRRQNHSAELFKADLKALGLRPRRQHDLRRSLISHAIDDGATRERLKPGTHGLGTSVLELYDSPDWSACCAAVAKLNPDAPEDFVGTPWGRSDLEAYMQSNEQNKVEAVGIEPAAVRTSVQGQIVGKSRTSRRDYRATSPLKPAIRVSTVPNVPTAARQLLAACDGDLDAAIRAVRSASLKRRSS